MKKILPFTLVLLFLSSGFFKILYAATVTSAQSGYFSVSSTWVGGTAPAYGDNIIIATGHTVTLDAAATVMSITIQEGATFDNGSFKLSMDNSTVGNPVYSNNGTHNGSGNLVAYNSGNTMVTGNGTTNCNIEIAGYGLNIMNSCNLTVNGNIQHSVPGNFGMNGKEFLACWQIGSNLTINGDIITDEQYMVGIVIVAGSTVTVNGNVSLAGGLNSGSGSTLTNNGTFNISGTLTLGPYSGYCQNGGMLIIGGDLLGGGPGETFFQQEVNSTLKVAGSIFPDAFNGELITSGSSLISGAPVEPNIVEYNGFSEQFLKMPSSGIPYSSLVINNSSSSGVVLNSNITIIGELALNNGLLITGSYDLILESDATIGGTPSAASMIVATGSGKLKKGFTSSGSFTFPVGDNDGSADYSPVALIFTSGSFSQAYAAVNLIANAYPGTSGSYLNRYWNVTAEGITDFSCNAQFDYVQADVTGIENDIFCYRVAPTSNQFDPANTSSHQLSAAAISSFGSFTGKQILNAGPILILNQVLLQGLYDAGGIMRPAMGQNGPFFSDQIADDITIELHNPQNYSIIEQSFGSIFLNLNGTAIVPLPIEFIGEYYITIKHRNSIETASASPVAFIGNTITFSFGTPSMVYGNNLVQSSDGYFLIYGGDVNHDGVVDTGDVTPVDNDQFNFATGYLTADVNGDGIVDTGDVTIIDNNQFNFIGAALP